MCWKHVRRDWIRAWGWAPPRSRPPRALPGKRPVRPRPGRVWRSKRPWARGPAMDGHPRRRARASPAWWGRQAALGQVVEGRDSQFDPDVVDALLDILEERFSSPGGARAVADKRSAPADGEAAASPPKAGRFPRQRISGDLAGALEELDVIPALAPAHDRLLAGAQSSGATGGRIAAPGEDDGGLTVAVLRRAHPPGSKQAILTIPEAVSAPG